MWAKILSRGKISKTMEATKTTQQQLFGDFVEAFRAYKKHKREWQARMEIKLAEEEEYIRNKREVLYAEYE